MAEEIKMGCALNRTAHGRSLEERPRPCLK